MRRSAVLILPLQYSLDNLNKFVRFFANSNSNLRLFHLFQNQKDILVLFSRHFFFIFFPEACPFREEASTPSLDIFGDMKNDGSNAGSLCGDADVELPVKDGGPIDFRREVIGNLGYDDLLIRHEVHLLLLSMLYNLFYLSRVLL
jgi:hypothetical protein